MEGGQSVIHEKPFFHNMSKIENYDVKTLFLVQRDL